MATIMTDGTGVRQSAGWMKRVAAGTLGLALAACSAVVPKTAPPSPTAAPPPVKQTAPTGSLPEDQARNRVAVLVPLTGPNAAVGQSIGNAANMAILDTGGANIRITLYDTAKGAAAAASRAIAEGNRLFLGPLLAEDVVAIAPVARAAHVPIVSFSNDTSVAGNGIYLMGFSPDQSIARVVSYAKSRNLMRVAALVPSGVYGRRASTALIKAGQASGVEIALMQNYDRSPASLSAAVKRLGPAGSYDAVLIADSARIALQAAPLVKKGAASARLMGTELWNTEPGLAASKPMHGAWFASVSDSMYRQLSTKYRAQFGRPPFRLASLGYDAVLLAVRIGAEWKAGAPFPEKELRDKGGFAGVDGAFRFADDGVAERMLDVNEIRATGFAVVSPAPKGF
ncbi:penicillin-binding protein activator [Sphingomonas sp. ID0503]|uniref:penicillin-binding protein activator n=1 Tax=Sphingomonas sp. ID0503 TaxID=3399691 RepID=UPI003AFB76D0